MNEETEADTSGPCGFMPLRFIGTAICLACLEELRPKAAKFHRLRCKLRRETGAIVNGERRDGERHVTADC